MIAPLYFSLNSENVTPLAISAPMFCGLCKRNTRKMAILFCKQCPIISNKQYLCRECDILAHAHSNRRKHKRRLLVIGSGLHKHILYEGCHHQIVHPLDHVRIKMTSYVFHSKGIHKESSTCLNFLTGTSGNSIHIQILAVETILASTASFVYLSIQYCGQFIGVTRMKPSVFLKDTGHYSRIEWENESFIIPCIVNVDKNINNILRVQVFEKSYGYKLPCCRGQMLLSLGTLERITKSQTTHYNDSIPKAIPLYITSLDYVGRLSVSAGLGTMYAYLRFDSFLTYLMPSFEAFNFQFVVSVVNKSLGVFTVGKHCRIQIQELHSILHEEHNQSLFHIQIFSSYRHQLRHHWLYVGSVSLSVDEYLGMFHSILVPTTPDISPAVFENNYLLAEIRLREIPARDLYVELDELSRVELGVQWRDDEVMSDSGEVSISHMSESEMSHLISKSQTSYSLVAESTSKRSYLVVEETRRRQRKSKATSFLRTLWKDSVEWFLSSRMYKACVEDVHWSYPRLLQTPGSDTSPRLYTFIPPPDMLTKCQVTLRCLPSNKGEVVKGLDEGVMSMALGELAEIKCRYDYAYGSNAVGSGIPPRSNIIFIVELLSINNHHAYPLPVRFAIHRINDMMKWTKELLSLDEIEGKKMKDVPSNSKGVSHSSFEQFKYKVSLKMQKVFGFNHRGNPKLSDADKEVEDEDEDEDEGISEEESIAEEHNASDDDDIAEDEIDKAAVAGVRYLWSKRKPTRQQYKKLI